MNFNELCQQLENGGEIIHAILYNVSQNEGRVKPTAKSWSILEVLCHLYDEEREDFREHLDLVLHRPDEEWKRIDPEGWVSARKYNEHDLTNMRDDFMRERRKSLDWLRHLSSPDWECAYERPFGMIQAGDLLVSWVMHDNLHIRQLIELRHELIHRSSQPYSPRYAGEW